MHFKLSRIAVAVAFATAPFAHAQTLPDAGRILQELQIPKQELPESVDIEVDVPKPAEAETDTGPKVLLQSVQFAGVTRFDEATLHALIAPAIGKEHSLRELQTLSHRITVYYRQNGYPFARAFLPAQKMIEGRLTIQVIEGRYGKVAASSADARLAEQAQSFLSRLRSGEVISSGPLERTVLILSDLPGVAVRPVVRPGEQVGTGDLDVRVTRTEPFAGAVSLDNYGNRYSGSYRLTAQGVWNSPFMLGDQLSAALMATDEELYFGSVGYALPLGTSGLRGDIGIAQSAYDLGEEFAALGATGTARVFSVGLSYPILRSNRANLVIAARYQYKDLVDEYERLDVRNEKSSHSVPVALQFDVRDQLFGGGITYGSLTWTVGELSLGTPGLRAQDVNAKTEGGFGKWNLEVARIQALPGGFSLYGRVFAQWANGNLDSSERMILGGANGVRAYPQGEGSGDEGVLGQVELRYQAGAFKPYAFWDAGRVRINDNPWVPGTNHRSLAGGGVGVRFQQGPWLVDAAAAWRHHGGRAQSDSRQNHPQIWAKVQYRF